MNKNAKTRVPKCVSQCNFYIDINSSYGSQLGQVPKRRLSWLGNLPILTERQILKQPVLILLVLLLYLSSQNEKGRQQIIESERAFVKTKEYVRCQNKDYPLRAKRVGR